MKRRRFSADPGSNFNLGLLSSWKTWMAFGRKVREASDLSTQVGSSGDSSEKTSLVPDIIDETLLSVKKGQEYVVVAVPAEAANGVGPVLPSFPGGKLFQRPSGRHYKILHLFRMLSMEKVLVGSVVIKMTLQHLAHQLMK